jgi:hypothetical protein
VYCWSISRGSAAYNSDIFATVVPNRDPTGIKSAFLAFLQKKYGYKADSNHPVECVMEPPSRGGFQAARMNRRYDGENVVGSKQALVETGWANTSAQAAASFTSAEVAANTAPIKAAVDSVATTTAAAAAAYENDMVCYSTTASVAYFSDIFDAPKPPPGPRGRQGAQLGAVFLAFLKTKYTMSPTDHAICGGPSVAGLKNAQTYKQQMEDLMKKQNKQIVETGWKYTT